MRHYDKSINLSILLALALFAVLLIWFNDQDLIMAALLIGSYYALLGFIGAAIIAKHSEHVRVQKEQKMSSTLGEIQSSQNRAEETSKNIDSRLKAIESKLGSSADASESASTGQCHEPAHSHHIER